jgi:hypothetical protein
MLFLAIIPFVLSVLLGLFAISSYKSLVRARTCTRETWSVIEAQMKRQAQLLMEVAQAQDAAKGSEPGTVLAARLRAELAETAEKLAYASQAYNLDALAYNTRIVRFPGSLFARWFHFEPVAIFTTGQSALPDVKVSFTAA